MKVGYNSDVSENIDRAPPLGEGRVWEETGLSGKPC